MSFLYCVYGLQLCSNRPVPGLVPLSTPGKSAVQAWLGLMPPWIKEAQGSEGELWYVSVYQDEHGEPTMKTWKLADGSYFRLRYRDGTEFVVDHQGTEIWATWPDQLTLEDTATYLLGPVLGFVLRLRSITCLHASAIAVGGQAIALLGEPGAGKSTTAAAFAQLGYPILSDDIVALSKKRPFLVQPGYPQVRLWPDSVKTLYGFADLLPRLTPTWDKRYLDLTERGYRFQQQPLPLAAVYILGERSEDAVAPFVIDMPARTALMALVGNTYANYLLDQEMRAQEFADLSRLVEHVPLRQVIPHGDPAQLSRLCHTILDDFRLLTNSAPDAETVSAR